MTAKGTRSLRPDLPKGAELLHRWRKKQGVTQEEAAHLVHVDHGAYCGFETGFRRPGLSRALTIERATSGAVPAGSWLKEASASYVSQRAERKKGAA